MQTPSPLKKNYFHFLVENETQCSETNKKSIFQFFIFLVMIEIVHNFQVFLPTKNGEKMFQKMRNVLKRDASQLRICTTPPSLRSGHLYMEDAQCAETNEKSCIRFLVIGRQR